MRRPFHLGFIAIWLLVTPMLAAGGAHEVDELVSAAKAPPHDERPNILLIVSEDNGMELGCYGAPVQTPILDNLANEGIRFQNAYVPQAGCSPSRASFLTGLYPHQHGQVGLATWKYSMYQARTPNLVNDLKRAGYATGIIGKIHVNPENAFDFDFHDIEGANFQRKDMDRYARAAFEFVQSSESPFFLQVNYPDAHDPFLSQVDGRPAKPVTGDQVEALPYFGVTTAALRQQTADYYNCMMRLDELVGELLAKLRDSPKFKNTFIVYMGDHGADMLRGKRTCYEGGVRVPMIMSWPEGMSKGITSQELVSTLDLYPTFMEVSGNPVPDHLPGKSLLPIVQGADGPHREYLFTEYNVHSNHNPYPQRTVRDRRFKLIYNPVFEHANPGPDYTIGARIGRTNFEEALADAPTDIVMAYERMTNPGEYELYDLEKDPYEWHNLANKPEYAHVRKRLTDVLRNWQKQTSDPFIDRAVAERFFLEVRETNEQKVSLTYHEWMDPKLDFD